MCKLDQWNQYFWSNSVKTVSTTSHLNWRKVIPVSCQRRLPFFFSLHGQGDALRASVLSPSPLPWHVAPVAMEFCPIMQCDVFPGLFVRSPKYSQSTLCVTPSEAIPPFSGCPSQRSLFGYPRYAWLESQKTVCFFKMKMKTLILTTCRVHRRMQENIKQE